MNKDSNWKKLFLAIIFVFIHSPIHSVTPGTPSLLNKLLGTIEPKIDISHDVHRLIFTGIGAFTFCLGLNTAIEAIPETPPKQVDNTQNIANPHPDTPAERLEKNIEEENMEEEVKPLTTAKQFFTKISTRMWVALGLMTAGAVVILKSNNLAYILDRATNITPAP